MTEQQPRQLNVIVMGTRPDVPVGGVAVAIGGFLQALDAARIQWRFIPTHDASTRRGKLIPWLRSIPSLVQALLFNRPDAIWLHSGAGVSMARKSVLAMLCWVFRMPVIWQLHSVSVDYWTAVRWRRWLFRVATRPAGQLAVLTPWWKTLLQERGITKSIIVLGNVHGAAAVAPAQTRPSTPPCIVLSSGRLVPGKGMDRLLRAIAGLASDARLVIAGDGPDRSRLEALADQLQLNDRVTFEGWVDHARLETLRNEAHCFALLTTNDSFGMGYIEAMSAGLPVLGSRWQSIGDIVEDGTTGLLVDPHDQDEARAALEVLLSDDAFRQAMGEAGRAAFDRLWTPGARAAQLRAVFAQACGRSESDMF